ncbi:hypothetical protein EVAR_38301_1 [Eumeta japonica]|uniref:Uncharacterized protein n=1 Tax=Eumeta variegata TaxID=151549 RepID=A0A4C1W9H8_EUMVA|nr:hypothetical protein EVAR_38301_1 [Eumeta japonica]
MMIRTKNFISSLKVRHYAFYRNPNVQAQKMHHKILSVSREMATSNISPAEYIHKGVDHTANTIRRSPSLSAQEGRDGPGPFRWVLSPHVRRSSATYAP